MSNIWFTSDEHYSHNNIIKYCKRPFDDIHHMNKTLQEELNTLVKPDDTVYHLGDFTFKDKELATSIINRLNGKHHFIRGNHDKWLKQKFQHPKIIGIDDYLEIHLSKGVSIALCHYPMSVWHHDYKGTVQLYGHCHGNHEHKVGNRKQMDVGVDNVAKIFNGSYRPIHLDEVISIMSKRENSGF